MENNGLNHASRSAYLLRRLSGILCASRGYMVRVSQLHMVLGHGQDYVFNAILMDAPFRKRLEILSQ